MQKITDSKKNKSKKKRRKKKIKAVAVKTDEELIKKIDEYLKKIEEEKETVRLASEDDYTDCMGISAGALATRKKRNPFLAEKLELIKRKQKQQLINNGLAKKYNPQITMLLLAHLHGIREDKPQQLLYADNLIFLPRKNKKIEN